MNKLHIALILLGMGLSSAALAEYSDCNVLFTPAKQDYSRIHKDELNFISTDKGQAAALSKRQTQLTVNCPENETFDLSFLGNTTPNGDLTFSDTGKIVLTLSNFNSDSGNVFIKRTAGKEISTEPVSSLRIFMGDRIKPVDANGSPVALRNFSATINIEPWLEQNTYRDLAEEKKIESDLIARIEQSE